MLVHKEICFYVFSVILKKNKTQNNEFTFLILKGLICLGRTLHLCINP